MSPQPLCCQAGQQVPLSVGAMQVWGRERQYRTFRNGGLTQGEVLFQKGPFPYGIEPSSKGDRSCPAPTGPGPHSTEGAVHGARNVWSSPNSRKHKVGEEAVQVPRAGWVLGNLFLLPDALWSLN